jgi:hypothetical protein
MAVVFALGSYNKAIAAGERGGFVMNFPAIGAQAGGPSFRDLSGQVVVVVDSAGVLKRRMAPGEVEFTSHVVRNVGTVPRRVRFSVTGIHYPYEIHSRERTFDARTGEIGRVIGPGGSVDFGVTIRLPEKLPPLAMPVDGRVVVSDAVTGAKLSELPIRVMRTGSFPAGSCCE